MVLHLVFFIDEYTFSVGDPYIVISEINEIVIDIPNIEWIAAY
jgi:hypothetical protein